MQLFFYPHKIISWNSSNHVPNGKIPLTNYLMNQHWNSNLKKFDYNFSSFFLIFWMISVYFQFFDRNWVFFFFKSQPYPMNNAFGMNAYFFLQIFEFNYNRTKCCTQLVTACFILLILLHVLWVLKRSEHISSNVNKWPNK